MSSNKEAAKMIMAAFRLMPHKKLAAIPAANSKISQKRILE